MSTFNFFGATSEGALLNFKSGSYEPTPDDFGGENTIENVLEEMTGTLLDAMPPRLFQSLCTPELLRVVVRATEGQTQFDLPPIFRPVVAGSAHVWRGWPAFFQDRPQLRTAPNYSDAYASAVNGNDRTRYTPAVELAASDFSVNLASGVVTLVEPMHEEWTAYISLRVDVDSADYAVPSLARIIENGAAGDLGARVYSRATDAWAHVENLRAGFAAAVEAMAKGERIPPELRVLQWWQEIEKAQENRLGTARMYRG